LAPDAAALHFKLGQIYRRRGLNERAQQEFAECAKLNGGHSSREVPNPSSPARPTKQWAAIAVAFNNQLQKHSREAEPNPCIYGRRSGLG
jgi:hypothetical protein